MYSWKKQRSFQAHLPLFRSGIEASDLKAKYKLRMIAQSLIRDISVSSSLKEKVGGTYVVEQMLVAGRDVIACLSPRRKMEIVSL